MKRRNRWYAPRRPACAALVGAFLAQTVTPAFAVSPGYTGFVSQLPGVYTTPPDVNVMFTLDDSGSMQSETIPDSADGVSTNMWSFDWTSDMRQWFITTGDTANVVRYYRSSAGNPLYYNPDVTYTPWPFAGDDSKLYPRADPAKACYYFDAPPLPAALPQPPAALTCGTWRNLAARVVTNSPDDGGEARGYWPATYFRYNGPASALTANGRATDNVTNSGNTAANFTKVEIKPGVASYPQSATSRRTDCAAAAACTYAEEIQNFANWFTYYRNRRLMAKGGTAAALAKQGTNLRMGFASLNSSPVVRIGVRQFQGANRAAFYGDMYPLAGTGFTPLRHAADQVGQYFQRNNTGNPWAEDPTSTTTKGTEYTCRRSFHILTTDGFWNRTAATAPASGNNDSFSGATPAKPDGTTYAYSNTKAPSTATDPLTGRFMIDPFRDGASTYSNTLADVAAYYWKTDLRPDLDNRVVPSQRDPAFWQHLTTFTVGLGISGSGEVRRTSDGSKTVPAGAAAPFDAFVGQPWLATQPLRDALVDERVGLTWTQPTENSTATGDDLIHASMNGRGRYFSATNPADLANGLASALSEAADQPGDQASVAADAPQVRVGGNVYQATFSPARWYGRLYAFRQNVSTGLVNNKPTDSGFTNPDQVWEASHKMPAPASRNIFTSTGAAGTATTFTWDNLSDTQKGHLGSDRNVLDYLRGDGSRELANGGAFRDRSRYTVGGVTGGVLGDVVNGSPIKGPDAGGGYDRLPPGSPGQATYSVFRSGSGLDAMRSTIFLGANDGMLHAFDIATGVERFAYVPNAVFNVPRSTSGQLAEPKLRMLSEPSYTHRFTVDGPPNVSDAFIGGAWKSVLVASNGAGARGVYAMDVTRPVVGSGFDTSKILWEFTEVDHADMGFVPSYPHVVRLRNGRWGVVFGNGYDSTNGQAKLFILDLETGTVLKEFAVGPAGDNGLSQPNFVLNANREVIAIYAGDLRGNLWKFDVSDGSGSAESVWNVAFGGSPMFTAVNGAGQAQPITVMPEITAHPNGGAMITFGTGRFFEASDTSPSGATPPNINLQVQSLYGVWDRPGSGAITMTAATRATVLQVQQTSSAPPPAGYGATTAESPNWAVHRGWLFDLAAGGERVNLPPQQVRSTLFVVANTPLGDPCSNGGTSRIFALDPITGAAPNFAVFDLDNDKVFESSEAGINIRLNPTGVLTQPIFQLPSQASFTLNVGATVAPFELFDRGQAGAARGGGVELARSFGSTPPGNIPNPCALLLTAAQSDTSLMSQYIQTCTPAAPKGRISWRQLK